MMKNISKPTFFLPVLIALFLLLALFFATILHFNFMRSDVLSYWQESYNWKTPYYEHPPLYALSIAFFRTITFNTLNPVVLMMTINLLTFSVCVICIYQFIRNAEGNHIVAAFGTILFGLWPFVGLTFTVMPIADSPAISLTLAGFIALQKSRRPLAALLLGLAIITHKGVWPIIGLIILADFYMRREFFSKKNFAYLAIILFPLILLWIAGSFYHHSITWLMERSIQVNTSVSGGYPILDGLIGTFQEGGLKGIFKGLVVLSFIILSIVTLVTSIKFKFKYYEYCIAIAIGVLLLFLFSSVETIWGPVRYSKFLVMPLMLSVNSYFKEKTIKPVSVSWSILLFAGLFISQLAYAWYMAVIYFANR
jgi:hypothetical protein